MRLILYFLTLSIVLLVSACSSAPKNYYSLDQEHVADTQDRPANENIKAIQVNLKQLPQKFNRPQLVVYDDTISPKVHVLNDSLWVAPLNEQTQNALANDLSNFLNLPNAQGINTTKDIKVINVNLDHFDMSLGKGTYIQANWQDKLNANSILCQAKIQTKPEATNDVAGLVDTQKDAIRALAAVIALHDDIKNIQIYKKIVSYDLGCT